MQWFDEPLRTLMYQNETQYPLSLADGIIAAVKDVGVSVPVVVRLEGNNAELGAKKLDECEFNIIPAAGFTEGAERIVALVNKKETV